MYFSRSIQAVTKYTKNKMKQIDSSLLNILQQTIHSQQFVHSLSFQSKSGCVYLVPWKALPSCIPSALCEPG